MFFILPFNKGYLVNFEIQTKIWDYIFGKILKLPTDNKNLYSTVGLLITEPVYNFPQIRKEMIKLFFEEYGFGKILISSSPQLAAFNYILNKKSKNENNCLIIDSGYSFTHVVPFIDGYKISTHMKRIDVGGKALTNYLKEIISYRQINVLDETYVINQMKEDCCYISTNFWKDLNTAKKSNNKLSCNYILPDFNVYKRGFVFEKDKHTIPSHCQSIRMNNERFQVPELLFNPSDINIDQIGISATIMYVIEQFNSDNQITEKVPEVKVTKELKYVETDETDEEEMDEDEQNDEEISNNEENSNNDTDDGKNGFENDIKNLAVCDENIQAHLYSNIFLIGNIIIIIIQYSIYFYLFQVEIVYFQIIKIEFTMIYVSRPIKPLKLMWNKHRIQ